MTTAPDHGLYTDDLDAMTFTELERLQRLLALRDPAEVLQVAVALEIKHRIAMRGRPRCHFCNEPMDNTNEGPRAGAVVACVDCAALGEPADGAA